MCSNGLDDHGPLTEPWNGAEVYVKPIREYCRKHGKSLSDLTREELAWFAMGDVVQEIVDKICDEIDDLEKKADKTQWDKGAADGYSESLAIIWDVCMDYGIELFNRYG